MQPNPPNLAGDVDDALDVSYRFWEALADDDWTLFEPLLSSEWGIIGADFPELARSALSIDREQTKAVNHELVVEILAVDRIRLRFTLAPVGYYSNPALPLVMPLELLFEDGAWGLARSTKRPAIAWITLPGDRQGPEPVDAIERPTHIH